MLMQPDNQPDTVTPRVLLVNGSPRAGGNSDVLTERIAAGVRGTSAIAETVMLRDLEYSSCVGCEMCRKDRRCSRFDDGVTPLYGTIGRARGLVLVSPVHNYNVTAWMKAFIDRLYCFYDFEYPRPGPWRSRLSGQGRRALVVAVAEQRDLSDAGFTLEAMRRPLEALGYEVMDDLLVLGTFDKGAVSRMDAVLSTAEAAGRDLAGAIAL
jgi:multimeric flavodoxin WrbA